MIKNKFSLFVATFLIISFFFLALPEKGYSGTNGVLIGCCQNGPDSCFNFGEISPACEDIDVRPGEVCDESSGQCVLPPRKVPTLSEWGLIAMAGVLGIVGYLVIRRRKVTA